MAELEGLVAEYPLREPLVRLLMLALAATGDRGRALTVFAAARERLADELGASPSTELAAEHVRLLRAEDAGTPVPTNLRAEISSFVGRERELAELDDLLATSRLTTLTGPGGAGKTRLAARAARQRLTAQPDGVWVVELAPLTDPADLVPAVLSALGVRDRVVRTSGPNPLGEQLTPVERLVAALSRRTALLVLDNCEHLVAAAADLAVLVLGACPGVRVLATSREPLGVTGEARYPVEPLALPPDDTPVDEVTSYPAVRLLVDRATAVRPGFAVTPENAGSVVRICRVLDGMPLAIELAAARLRALTPEQLAARLDDRFAVLTGGSRTALPRHQTLRAVVDWSFELLDPPERTLWRRLSVFTGGATLEAVEAVCADDLLPTDRVLDALTGLVDRSLVVVRDERYLMLETIRAYGQMRLDEADERARTRAAHTAYFRRLADAARYELIGQDQLAWLARLASDHDNLMAAVRAATAAGEWRDAIGLVASLGWYWWLRGGQRAEGVELAAAALALVPDLADEPRDVLEDVAVAYTNAALLAIDGAREVARATAWFDRAEGIISQVGRPESPVLRMVAPLKAVFRAFEGGALLGMADVDMPVDDPFPWVAAMSRVLRAHMWLNAGRAHDRAEEDFRLALTLFRSIGDRWGAAFTLYSLGMMASWRGELAAALAFGEEALRFVVELEAWEDRVQFRVRVAHLRGLAGERERAYAELAIAEHEARHVGASDTRGSIALLASDLARLDGDLVEAEHQLRRVEELFDEQTVAPQFKAVGLSARGFLHAARGDHDSAREEHRRAVELAVSSMDAPVIAQSLIGLAEVALDEGDAVLAATVMGASDGIRGMPDRSVLDGVRVVARIRAALGPAAYERAYARGLASTLPQVAELVGVPMPIESPGG